MIGHSMLKTNNDRVQLKEIFTSIEGEGPYFGTKTLFVRMSGCHLHCYWCDTTDALAMNSGNSFSVDEAKDLIIKELQPNTYKINFTGGEPLIQHEAVAKLANFMKQKKDIRTYIESSCFDSIRFAKVIPYIDICKIEFKMSDSQVVDHKIYKYAQPGNLVGFVIQPCYGDNQPGLEKLLSFYDCVYPIYDEVRIVPQLHKLIGVR